ncbi:MAG: FecR domain-containing protein [Planctomycetaceae bacterium]|nr:FecR domain-containing protein [Planctomycetaceae bacterium]
MFNRLNIISIIALGFLALSLPMQAQQAPAAAPQAPAPAAAAPAVAGAPLAPLQVTVVTVTGSAQKLETAKAGAAWQPLKAGDVLGEQTLIRTGLGAQVVLKLADRGTATVSSGTKIGIAEFRKMNTGIKARLGLKYGSINTKVDPSKGRNDLKVATPVATMTITGTDTDTANNADTGYAHQNNTGTSNTTTNNGFSQNTSNGEGTNGQGDTSIDQTVQNTTTNMGDTGGGQTNNELWSQDINGSGRGIFENGASSGSSSPLGNTNNPGPGPPPPPSGENSGGSVDIGGSITHGF